MVTDIVPPTGILAIAFQKTPLSFPDFPVSLDRRGCFITGDASPIAGTPSPAMQNVVRKRWRSGLCRPNPEGHSDNIGQEAEEREKTCGCKAEGRGRASHETSPVLSTRTFRTTPLPPTSSAADTKESAPSDSPVVWTVPPQWPITVRPLESPSTAAPDLVHPGNPGSSPSCSRRTIGLWADRFPARCGEKPRQYHCRCRICERAAQIEDVAAGPVTASTHRWCRIGARG